MLRNINRLVVLLALLVQAMGCKNFLDAKPDKKLAVISSLEELQEILDYYNFMNNRDVGAGEISSDDYYLTDVDYSGLSNDYQKRMYVWAPDNLFVPAVNDWSSVYQVVYRANSVLENISLVSGNQVMRNDIMGQALYYRARSFLHAAFVWLPAYDSIHAKTDLGLPLRLNSDFNVTSSRSSVQETYKRIIDDLVSAIPLLAISPPHKMRPSKAAAYALLARTYLAMRVYGRAGLYADSCLRLYDKLLDYNNSSMVGLSSSYSFQRFNDEVLTVSGMRIPGLLYNNIAKIDSGLLQTYSNDDLRKVAFFKNNNDGTYGFKGSYERSTSYFTSVATDEVYLIRSECFARTGEIDAAMNDLNKLLSKRWKTGTFVPFLATNQNEALSLILKERRKELVMRGLRWTDIKRLNKEGANITLKRLVNNKVYLLPPNDARFALPIPDDVISLSGISQNPR